LSINFSLVSEYSLTFYNYSTNMLSFSLVNYFSHLML